MSLLLFTSEGSCYIIEISFKDDERFYTHTHFEDLDRINELFHLSPKVTCASEYSKGIKWKCHHYFNHTSTIFSFFFCSVFLLGPLSPLAPFGGHFGQKSGLKMFLQLDRSAKNFPPDGTSGHEKRVKPVAFS